MKEQTKGNGHKGRRSIGGRGRRRRRRRKRRSFAVPGKPGQTGYYLYRPNRRANSATLYAR